MTHQRHSIVETLTVAPHCLSYRTERSFLDVFNIPAEQCEVVFEAGDFETTVDVKPTLEDRLAAVLYDLLACRGY